MKCNGCKRKMKRAGERGVNGWICTTCFRRPTSAYVDEAFIPAPATDATNVAPGTTARVQIYAERVERGETVFAEGDRVDFEESKQKPLIRSGRGKCASALGPPDKDRDLSIRVVSTTAFRRHH